MGLITSQEIIDIILAEDYRGIKDEKSLQVQIQMLLVEKKIKHEREHKLSPKHKIDFLIGSIGVEIKIKGSALAIARQLQDYAQYDSISELILFTTKRFNMFPEINKKKVHNIWKILI